MASLWRQLDLEATHEEVLAIMQKYDTDGNGQLELGEFTVLVQELRAFHESSLSSATVDLVKFAGAGHPVIRPHI